jgi:stage III sporulation protein AA
MFEKIYDEILSYFPSELSEIQSVNQNIWNTVEEIRIRIGQTICIRQHSSESFLSHVITEKDIMKILENFSDNSIYSVQSNINNGYITIRGGHRIGISGTSIIEDTTIKNIKYISSLNIRIAREIKGCSESLLNYIIEDNMFKNSIIISPPGCGKTTILRDLVRYISNGYRNMNGKNIGLIDERSEIAAVYKGTPQNDVGIRTDIMNNCLKHIGINLMVRSMGPQIIATDEIGNDKDIDAIYNAVYSGVGLLLTAHGKSFQDVPKKLLDDKMFSTIIILTKDSRPGVVKEIYMLDHDKYTMVYNNIPERRSYVVNY